MTKRKYHTDEERLSLIQECRLSGLTDKQWCEAHQICPTHLVPVPSKKEKWTKTKNNSICTSQKREYM